MQTTSKIIAVSLIAAVAGTASGARVDMWGQPVAFYDGNSNPLSPEVKELGSGVYQVGPTAEATRVHLDLVFTISELGAGEYGIGGFNFEIRYPPTSPSFKNWQVGSAGGPWDPVMSTLDVPPSVWGFRLDNNNWQGPSDPRLDVGKYSPECLLEISFDWDGLTPGTFDFSNGFFRVVDDEGTGHIAPKSSFSPVNGGAIAFVPEPTALALFLLGGLAAIGRRRRQKPSDKRGGAKNAGQCLHTYMAKN